MKKNLLLLLFVAFLISCQSEKKDIFTYHKFEKNIWNRFDKLHFTVDIRNQGDYDVFLEAVHTQGFERDQFSFNMIMNTPSGEERINEYSVPVRKASGSFAGKCEGDSCILEVLLKKEITLTPGQLSLEIENLIPYIETGNLKGVGIRVVPEGK